MSSAQPPGEPGNPEPRREPDIDELLTALMRAMQVMRRRNERLFQQHGGAPHRGLSVPRMRLLGELAFHGPLRMSELAHEMGVTPRTTTTMVDALEREGLVERRPDPADRRAVIVTLTESGQALGFGEFPEIMRRAFEEMFAPLDEVERGQFYRILRKLTSVWEAEDGPAESGAVERDPGRAGGRGRFRKPQERDAAGRRGGPVGRLRFSRVEPAEPREPAEQAGDPGEPNAAPRGRDRRRRSMPD